MTVYACLIEYNDAEGETWNWWIPVDGNEAALQQLAAYLLQQFRDDIDLDPLEVTDERLPGDQVDTLVAHSDTACYHREHTKLAGTLTLPDNLNWATHLYKGGIQSLMSGSEATR